MFLFDIFNKRAFTRARFSMNKYVSPFKNILFRKGKFRSNLEFFFFEVSI